MTATASLGRPLTEQIERAQLWLENGYKPVPCLRYDAPRTFMRDGREVNNSPGKRPHPELWHDKERSVYGATPETIAGWRNLSNIGTYRNLGIACGWLVGADSDVSEPALAAEVERIVVEHLGASPLRRVGLAPKALLLYRAATHPLEKVLTGRFRNDSGQTAQLEIMGHGQQVVGYGTHPDTKQPYSWGEASPDDTPLTELPAVTAEQVADLIADATALFLERGYRLVEPEQPRVDASADAHDAGPFDKMTMAAVNNAAMADFPAWVPLLFDKGEARKTRSGYRVSSAALGRDREEDISITPKGIVDFGEHDMGDRRGGKRTPVELVCWHRGWPTGEAARWLAELVKVELPGHPKPNGEARPGGPEAKAKPQGLPEFKLLGDLELSREVFWLIDETLPRGEMAMVYGPGGSGKTYLGTSLAIGLASGKWHGREAESGAVLYCAFERHGDAEDRLAAQRDHLDLGSLPIGLLPLAGYCLDETMAAHIIEQARKLAELTKRKVHVVVDTVSAALGGGKEDDQGLGILRRSGELIVAETKATLFWLHHEGKADHNGPRGHLVLAEACMVWWRVEEREDGSRVVHVDKANRGPAHVPLFAFRLVPFIAGEDVKGRPIQLCELQLVDLEPALASPRKVRFGLPNGEQPRPRPGKLQKIMADELKRLAWKHPAGVEEHLLRSAFILQLQTVRQGQKKPELTANDYARKFRRTLVPMIATDDRPGAIERLSNGLLLPGDDE